MERLIKGKNHNMRRFRSLRSLRLEKKKVVATVLRSAGGSRGISATTLKWVWGKSKVAIQEERQEDDNAKQHMSSRI